MSEPSKAEIEIKHVGSNVPKDENVSDVPRPSAASMLREETASMSETSTPAPVPKPTGDTMTRPFTEGNPPIKRPDK